MSDSREARDLADRFHQRWLVRNPFAASMYGIAGYDDLVPDESGGDQAWRAEIGGSLGRHSRSCLMSGRWYQYRQRRLPGQGEDRTPRARIA